MLIDPAVCVFVTGAAWRVKKTQEVKLKGQRLWGLSLGRIALLCRPANIKTLVVMYGAQHEFVLDDREVVSI